MPRLSKVAIGMKFGRLEVKSRNTRKIEKAVLWNCLCECGRWHTTRSNGLLSGKILSCGCLIRSVNIEDRIEHNEILRKLAKLNDIYQIYTKAGIHYIRKNPDKKHQSKNRRFFIGDSIEEKKRKANEALTKYPTASNVAIAAVAGVSEAYIRKLKKLRYDDNNMKEAAD